MKMALCVTPYGEAVFSREQVSQRRALVSAGDRVCQAFLEPCEGLGASPDDLGAAWRPDEVGWVDPSSLRESLRWQRQQQCLQPWSSV